MNQANCLDSFDSYAEWLLFGGHIAALTRPDEPFANPPGTPKISRKRKKRSSKNDYSPADRATSGFSTMYLFPHGTDSPLLNEESKRAKRFRRRFRVPYKMFRSICDDMTSTGTFVESTDAKGLPCIQLELLVLASLRYLASGCSFDLLEELTCVDEETIHCFFHEKFCIWGVVAAEEHIKLPSDDDSLAHVMGLYAKLGLPGCVGSVDCVHVIWDKCKAGLKSACKGKENDPTLAFEVVSSHTKRILSVSQYFFGATNDKTIARMDRAIVELRSKNTFLGKIKWRSFDRSGGVRENQGGYFICDGGYHNWECLIPPYKHQIEGSEEAEWSHHIESMRKDVECVFGILKKRFMFLKHPIRLHKLEHIQNIFVTCCVLHNLLLDYDGFDDWERWNMAGEEDIEHTNLERWAINRAANTNRTILEGFTRSEARRARPNNFTFAEEEDEQEDARYECLPEHEALIKRRSILIDHYEYLKSKRSLKFSVF